MEAPFPSSPQRNSRPGLLEPQRKTSSTRDSPSPWKDRPGKSCGQLTSTTWVWICGRQRTSTPSRRFSRFTTRLASSSHRHTFVSPATISLSLWVTLPLIRWMFFFFLPLETKPKMFKSQIVWLAASLAWMETGSQAESLWTPAHVLKKILKKILRLFKIRKFKVILN